MATKVQKAPMKTFYFSLRQYDPDQVLRVKSQPAYLQTPLKSFTKIKKNRQVVYDL
ncbi:hypothetical protein VO54_03804 [Elizabethkingia miricola]|nr:hypothetical protein VO54_03804 [Elizabethkingia miricola]